MKIILISLTVLTFVLFTGACFAVDGDAVQAERIKQQLMSPGRDQYDAIKDPGRKPLEVIRFLVLKMG